MAHNAYEQDNDLIAYVQLLAENAQAQHAPLDTSSIAPRIVKGGIVPAKTLVDEVMNDPTFQAKVKRDWIDMLTTPSNQAAMLHKSGGTFNAVDGASVGPRDGYSYIDEAYLADWEALQEQYTRALNGILQKHGGR